MASISWMSPSNGQALSVTVGGSKALGVWCEGRDGRGYYYRIRLTASNACVKFANNTTTTYTDATVNDDETYKSVYVYGVSSGTATITLAMEWSYDGSTWEDSGVTTRTVNATVTGGSVVTCPLYVNINGTWKQCTAAYVNVNGTWKQVSESKANINGTWK